MKQAWFVAHDATDPSQLPAHGWKQVELPHQWSLDPDTASLEPEIETGWYRIEFPPSLGRRWVEIFADYIAEAWLDGVYQGSHTGYFEPWVLEMPTQTELLLRVAAPKEEVNEVWPQFKRQIKGVFGQHDCRPGGVTARGQDRSTGGLWGGIRYFRTGDIALLHIGWRAAPSANGWRLWLDLELDRSEANLPYAPNLRAEFRREPVHLSLTPDNFSGETFSAERSLDLVIGRRTYNLVWDLPELPLWEVWERGFPHLYRLDIRIDSQTTSAPVGFRTITQQGDWVALNGERLFLRGTNIIPTQWLAGYSEEFANRDVQLLVEAHLNAVRVHAHLTHPAFYQACDRRGLLVWQDFPLQWGYSRDEVFAQEAVRQARAMVRQLGCHPSIYLWCAHNEPSHNRQTLDPLLAMALRQADATRLVKEASDFREHPYPGWYWGHLRDFLAAPGGPLPSEFGAQALPDAEQLRRTLGPAAWPPDWPAWVYHNFQADQTFRVAGIAMGASLEEFTANSQAYQARLVKLAIEAYRRAKGRITGYFHFMFVEPWEGITWAVLDVSREPKAGYYALKEASTPVLLSFVPFRETLEIGMVPLNEVWLINDLPRPLQAHVFLRLEGPANVHLYDREQVVEAHEAQPIFHIGEFYERSGLDERFAQLAQTLRELPEGEYRLVGEARQRDILLSRNEITIQYQKPFAT